jgi:hypothetical protein
MLSFEFAGGGGLGIARGAGLAGAVRTTVEGGGSDGGGLCEGFGW